MLPARQTRAALLMLHFGVVRLDADLLDTAVARQPRRLVRPGIAGILDSQPVGTARRSGFLQTRSQWGSCRADRRTRHRRHVGVHRLDTSADGGTASGVRSTG